MRHCAKRQAVLARRPPRFSRPRQETEVPCAVLNRRASPCWAHRSFRTAPPGRCFGHWPRSLPVPPGINSKPCGFASSSALRANIARFFCALRRMGLEGTLGAPPLKPRQEPEVPAPPGFYSEPCNRVSSSALRANIARLFGVLRCMGLGVTLGAPPLKPRQEPEVPAPPGFYSEPCNRAKSSALPSGASRFCSEPCSRQEMSSLNLPFYSPLVSNTSTACGGLFTRGTGA